MGKKKKKDKRKKVNRDTFDVTWIKEGALTWHKKSIKELEAKRPPDTFFKGTVVSFDLGDKFTM